MNGRPPDAAPTPEEVRTATFSQSQLAWRGYSEDEVRAFLGRVADSMTAAERQREALRSEIDRLRNFYREHGHDVDLVRGANGRRRRDTPDDDGLVHRIRGYVEVQVGRAREYADLLDGRAGERADAVLQHSAVQSERAVGEALRQSATGDYRLVPVEVDRASLWLRAFFHALYAQLQATSDRLAAGSR
jgi:DivIVA domain-containing protein